MAVRFVDALPTHELRLLDGGAFGYSGDELYALSRRGGSAVALVTQDARWGGGTIVCRRGVRRVPFLSSAVDLAVLAAGWVPLHGSAWTTPEGVSALASGFAHTGKTGALLAACARGALPIGDDRILLSGDGSLMVGLGRPVQVKDWHLAQLPLPQVPSSGARRALARATQAIASPRSGRRGSSWARFLDGAIARARNLSSVEIELQQLGGGTEPRPCARPQLLLLMETHDDPRVLAEPADPDSVPARLAAHVGVELGPGLRSQLAYDYVHSGAGWREVYRAPKVALSTLERATRDLPAWIIRHPYPCSLDRLHAVTSELAASVAGRFPERA
jgi:hypothetical protein